jgi:hypothetical protein
MIDKEASVPSAKAKPAQTNGHINGDMDTDE